MNLELQLPPGKTATIQLYARIGGAAVGSPIAGVPDVGNPALYRFALGANSTGDFDVQLLGVSNPNGLPFPMRDGIAYFGIPWTIIDATIVVPPVIPAPIAGLCNVLVSATLNGVSVAGAKASYHLEDQNNTVDGYLVSRAIENRTTDNAGNCTLTLIQNGQFTRGGTYRIRVADPTGKMLFDRRVTAPNTPTANAEDLPDA